MKPIASITDRAAYVALGASNTTPGGSWDETYTWTQEATSASVWDASTEQQREQAVRWTFDGETQAETQAFALRNYLAFDAAE